MKAYRAALEVYTREALPQNWASKQNDLAHALSDQAGASEGSGQIRLLGEAAKACRLALEVYTSEAMPLEWALTQNNLGIVLSDQADLSEGADRVRLLGETVQAYQLASEVRTREALPQEWAATQNNLAIVFRNQADGFGGSERARLLGEAVQSLRNSMQVLGASANRGFQLPRFLGDYSAALLFAQKPLEAIKAAEEALALAPGELWIVTSQADGYLLAGQFAKAEEIYRRHATVKLDEKRTFAEAVLDEFAELRKAGIDHPDMAKIEGMLRAPAVKIATH